MIVWSHLWRNKVSLTRLANLEREWEWEIPFWPEQITLVYHPVTKKVGVRLTYVAVKLSKNIGFLVLVP